MKGIIQIIINLIATHVLLLLAFVFSIYSCKTDGFLLISITQSILLILFIAGSWEFFGIKFKWIYCISVEILILIALFYRLYTGKTEWPSLPILLVLLLIQAYLFWLLIKIFKVIFKIDKESMEIAFPFKRGLYLITDGGNSKTCRMMNAHFHSAVHKKNNINKSMLYATDIVKSGNKRTSHIPKTQEEYAIFNEKVFSPIEGAVIKVVNDIEDNLPFARNYPYNFGNTVVIKKDNYYLLLGHLKKGSITVKVGDYVKRNDLLGAAGNSGWSDRPHLHMQLTRSDTSNYWNGRGVCITFKNKNLYKNRLLIV